MNNKKSDTEFLGVLPKNQAIMERVRKDGYYGMMFNKADFMDSIVWASNVVYEYKDFFRSYRNRIVVPVSDMPFWKIDLVNAHFLMVIYYNMKKNYVLLEEMKLSLFTVAKFQEVSKEDNEIMKQWDQYMELAQQKMDSGDLGGYDVGNLHGTEKKYEQYSRLVAKEVEKYQSNLAKL